MKRILLTGGTGFIGSHIASELLRQGHFVWFVSRSNSALSADKRILRALTPLTPLRKDRYKVIDHDLVSPLHHLVLKDIDEVWHCAASLSFRDEDEAETFATNVGGTQNLLWLLSRSHIRRIHYLSTAYVSGLELNNPYERSKAAAEDLITKWAASNKGEVTIYRPSIIVGSSKTGFASKFDGYYACARVAYRLKQFLEADLCRSKEKYVSSGISVEGDVLNVPIAFPGFPETLINMLPVDVAVAAILECSSSIGTFFITNNRPISLDELIKISTGILHIRGIYVGEPRAGENAVIRQLQQKVQRATMYYRPYLYEHDIKKFSGKSVMFPITENFISLVLGYAKQVNFIKGE